MWKLEDLICKNAFDNFAWLLYVDGCDGFVGLKRCKLVQYFCWLNTFVVQVSFQVSIWIIAFSFHPTSTLTLDHFVQSITTFVQIQVYKAEALWRMWNVIVQLLIEGMFEEELWIAVLYLQNQSFFDFQWECRCACMPVFIQMKIQFMSNEMLFH